MASLLDSGRYWRIARLQCIQDASDHAWPREKCRTALLSQLSKDNLAFNTQLLATVATLPELRVSLACRLIARPTRSILVYKLGFAIAIVQLRLSNTSQIATPTNASLVPTARPSGIGKSLHRRPNLRPTSRDKLRTAVLSYKDNLEFQTKLMSSVTILLSDQQAQELELPDAPNTPLKLSAGMNLNTIFKPVSISTIKRLTDSEQRSRRYGSYLKELMRTDLHCLL